MRYVETGFVEVTLFVTGLPVFVRYDAVTSVIELAEGKGTRVDAANGLSMAVRQTANEIHSDIAACAAYAARKHCPSKEITVAQSDDGKLAVYVDDALHSAYEKDSRDCLHAIIEIGGAKPVVIERAYTRNFDEWPKNVDELK